MEVVGLLVAVVVLVAAGAVAVGRWTGGAGSPPPDEAALGLPPGPLSAEDVEAVRLPVALRGYRMADVDDVLDRLAAALRERDEELERVRAAGRTAGDARPGR